VNDKTEIEITSEMIEAGAVILVQCEGSSPAFSAEEVFRAMTNARNLPVRP